ncbi:MULTISPECIES: hypothetical protein [unclassified Streptomyces]|uniref:hypothetical protein n=1 Tax=unclassified Streptomyces TaxID=2593676 RepID=UPI0003717A31|nr:MULTISPECIES: hypothetical protein [unclassified Streptomyces]
MGTSRAWGRRAVRRFPAALCLAAAAVTGLTACEPADGLDTLNTAAVAVTTDRTATRALEHEGIDVSWLSCTAGLGKDDAKASASASAQRVAEVHCDGRTKDRQKITLDGQVTHAVNGRCVRGDMTAKSGGRAVFRATLLGDCAAPATTAPPPGGAGPGNGPTATVTVTVTAYPGK